MYSSLVKFSYRSVHSVSRIAAVLSKETGEEVTVKGWVQSVRKMKKNIFLDISDGSSSTELQVVVPKIVVPSDPIAIGVGDSLEVTGNLSTSPQGQKEIQAASVNIVGHCNITEGFPFTPKQNHPPEYVRDYLHLRPRVSYMNSLFRIRHRAAKIIQDYFDMKGFTYIHTPIITENDCEGAGEVFVVKPDNSNLLKEMAKPNVPFEESFFDKKVFLSVSGQLCLEAMSHGLGNTYTLAASFRSENSKSPLHLSEFYMLEAELGFLSSIHELTDFIENMIKNVTSEILRNCEEDLNNCTKRLSTKTNLNFEWLNKKWITITYDEAYEILYKRQSELTTELSRDEGYSKEQEFLLVKHFNSPIFIINWPKRIKPFYMKTIPDDETKVYAVDLVVPNVGEIIGGSLRENDYNRLKNIIPDGLQWYLDLRKFGGIPTGGFGMGFERYLQLITGIKNIRDVIPFPRYPHNCRM